MSGVEARLVLALAVFGSALLHAGLVVLTPPREERARAEVRIEIVRVLRSPTPAKAGEAEPAQDAPEPSEVPAAGAPRRAAAPTAQGAPEAPRSWRARLAAREAAHRAAMAQRAHKAALLELDSKDAATASERPDAVYTCGPGGPLVEATFDQERDVSAYAGVLPAGLFPRRYVRAMRELRGAKARGRWHFALPEGMLPIALDAPERSLVAAGHSGARCLVGVDISARTLFPLRFLDIPLRLVDAEDRVWRAVVDVALADDGTFTLTRRAGDPLPFSAGALYDHEAVGRNLRQHYVGARLLRDLAGLVVE